MKQTHITSVSLSQDGKSPFWMAQWTLSTGLRQKKSTKVPVAGGLFQGERLSRTQAKSRALLIAHELADDALRTDLQTNKTSMLELCDLMLQGKLGRISVASYENAKAAYKLFTSWLGKRATQPIRTITKADIKSWVIYRRAQVRAATCRKDLSAIRSAFEWASAVRCCLGTFGQRLGDILSLKWEQFDFTARTVNIVTGKTARVLTQPMQPWFYEWALQRYEQRPEGAVYLHPRLHVHSNPSPEFTQLVRLHGIGVSSTTINNGRRRTWHSKTFHSLRSTVATLLQAAGVSQGMAMQLVGHESADVHAVYIRPSIAQLQVAAHTLPSIE
ncbi:MAG: tyrosine-type recombinase/integrase [Akkermansia sp.]|nr:tyrosine-type recombinase/integrase [Akkermansia sp.]